MGASEPGVPHDYYSAGLRARFSLDAAKAAIASPKEPYADIGYSVDEAAFRRRSAARLAAGRLPTSVPDGWPTQLEGPLVWTAADFNEVEESAYVCLLTDEDKQEISRALNAFKGGIRTMTPNV